jgi:hypothetical protein
MTPEQIWMSTRDTLAHRRGNGWEQWLPEVRLLHVLPCSHHYAWNVQHAFQRRRNCNILLSCLDWIMMGEWADAGIPLAAVLRGIDAAFDVNDRRHDWYLRQINSLAFCKNHVLRETVAMKEAAVGSHYSTGFDYDNFGNLIRGPVEQTLLIALPANGRKIFMALQQEEQLTRAAHAQGVGIAMTVYPDAWQKAEARQRFGLDLNFMDTDFSSSYLGFPVSRQAGRSNHPRSRQPFLRSSIG